MANTAGIKGYIAINENKEVFYIPDGDSPELTILRVLKGTEFNVIDLSKVSNDAIQYLKKV